jgi:putative ABC transport system permease protein
MLRGISADVRYGFRLLRRTPGFTTIAVLALALGIGANTAIFSAVNAAFLKALPYHDSDRLVMLWQDASFVGYPRATVTPADYSDWKRQSRGFSGMAAMRVVGASLTADGPPEQLGGQAITAGFFDVLGVQPSIGRVFTEDEDRARAQVALISYGLWQRRYQGDPAMVGRTIPLNGAQFTVIGVLPRGFIFQGRTSDFWVPASMTPATLANRDSHLLNVVARVKPEFTVAQARQDLRAVIRKLQDQGLFDKRSDVAVIPLREDLLGNTREALLVLLGAAGCVLLIACANLANLLLSRSMVRRREMAVRAALGAGCGRLVRQMMTESVILSLAGGGLGLGFAFAAMRMLARLVPATMPETSVPTMDGGLLAFTVALSVLTGLVFSIVPALQTARVSLNEGLKQGGRGVSRAGSAMRDGLVVAEVASAIVLLVGAGLLFRTMANLRGIDVGFRSDHLLTMRATPPRAMTHTERINYYDRVIAAVLALPGVDNAAFVSNLPFQQAGDSRAFQIDGLALPKNGPVPLSLYRTGTNDYLKTLGVRVLAGRLFEPSDGGSSVPVVAITETFAREFFREQNPLGHRITVTEPNSPARTIVGVVSDVHERGYEQATIPGIYLPIAQAPDAHSVPQDLVVRTKGDPLALAEAVRRIIWNTNPRQPVTQIRAMDEWIDLDVADRKQQTTLLGAFAALALLLASIGLYGVLSYSVAQRRREIGVRMALGASRANVTGAIVRHGMQVTLVGLITGFGLSWVATRTIGKLLYGVRPSDPATFAGVAFVLTGVALGACWMPARRASRVDPMLVLREE